MKLIIIGKKFGNWTIINNAPDRIDSSGKHHKRYLCRCECGTELEKDYYKLKKGAKMCKSCYLKIARFNSIPFEHKMNNYCLGGEYGIVYATNTNNAFYFDLEDYERIKPICWHENIGGYLEGYNTQIGHKVLFHRYIMNANDEKVVDHINRQTYDCRKRNLRICTQADNAKNRSLYKNNKSGKAGIIYDDKSNRWAAYININKRHISLGYFKNKENAILSRIKAEEKYFGEYAPK